MKWWCRLKRIPIISRKPLNQQLYPVEKLAGAELQHRETSAPLMKSERQLEPNDAGKGPQRPAPPVRSGAGLVRQELDARRLRTGRVKQYAGEITPTGLAAVLAGQPPPV